jgi:hypothetical protein
MSEIAAPVWNRPVHILVIIIHKTGGGTMGVGDDAVRVITADELGIVAKRI